MSARRFLQALVAGAALTASLAFAASAQESRHIRGTLTAVEGNTLTVETPRGSETVQIGDKTGLFMVTRADFNSIQAGKFVGITSVEEGGKRVAKEVHVFAEPLRGLGEGHYPWDLESGPNMMTNANIASVEGVGSGRELKLDYKGGSQMITVPPDAVIVEFDKTTPDQLSAGRKVFILERKQPDGSMAVGGVVVGKEGLKPPM